MKRIITSILLILSIPIFASHIDGGEFRMQHLSNYHYKIDLILYFDRINGNPGSKDPSMVAKIFRDSDGAFISSVMLILAEETSLTATQAECSNGEIVIDQLTYTATLQLPPEIFDDPGGYYIVGERCCRNYNLSNIFSQDPAAGGLAAGQIFFLHFPPVVKEGIAFINSSPELETPPIDFACPGRPFYVDFSGEDVDGDSLAYSVVTPWSTHTTTALPEVMPKPFPEVQWRPGYNENNIMGGNPDLRISKSGLVTVQAQVVGLFAFAILCEEYRNKIKIGEVRREFSLLVVDGCDPDTAPEISAKTTGGSYSSLPLEVHFDNTVSNEDRCIQVKVSDDDITADIFENIRISAVPMGFAGDVLSVLPPTVEATLNAGNPFAEFSICFDRCPLGDADFYEIGIIAYDDACSVPLSDTVRIKVFIDGFTGGCLEQNILFPAISDKTFGDSAFALNATSSSGLPVTFSSSDISVASISSSLITAHRTGKVIITAMQSGDGDYKAANPVNQQLCFNPMPPKLDLIMNDGLLQIRSSSETGNLWYKDGVQQSDLVGDTIAVMGEVAEYTARVAIDNCVSQSSNAIVAEGAINEEVEEDDIVLGINEVIPTGVKIFPNPVIADLEIHFTDAELVKEIEWYNANGQGLLKYEIAGDKGLIDMAAWEPGLYFVFIKIKAKTYSHRIIKK